MKDSSYDEKTITRKRNPGNNKTWMEEAKVAKPEPNLGVA